MDVIRIATRKSPLALWQAETISCALSKARPGLRCELVPMSTQGDRFLEAKLIEIGGKNVFIKELEEAMLDGRADIAVHSMKDVTADLPDGLALPVFAAREDPRDAFVSPHHQSFAALPPGARVGTASSRRQCQLLERRPDLQIGTVRGNVNTRLAKLDAGEFDALVLAAAGLKRLGLGARIRECFEPQHMLPAVGQGVMGIECRAGAPAVLDIIRAVDDLDASIRVRAERGVTTRLGGGCHVPMAAYAVRDGRGALYLRALVGDLDGTRILRARAAGSDADPEGLGQRVAEALLAQGAAELLAEVPHAP